MFKHFKKLWSRAPEADDSSPVSNATPVVSETRPDGSSRLPLSSQIGPLDAEADELDVLYRQALAAMEAVETGFDTIADELPAESEESPGEPRPSSSKIADIPEHIENQRAASRPSLTPQQVLEAALFVGGIDLTLKRLCSLLNDEFPPDAVERFIHDLNERYEAEGRPYDVRFGTGGYRMQLRADYDAVRNRVFGLGPREVKLSQDALEVLSLVAYQQPIAGEHITELRGANAAAVVRQLLRRELIALERSEGDRQDVCYCTTPRFLQAFGMHTLHDLPQVDDLEFK